MLLTKKKLHKIRKSKIQSRKRYRKKKGGRRNRRKNKSFRKRRKALNLRKRTLKYKKKGGGRNELFVILPKEKTGNLIRSFVLARITKPDNLSSAEFIAVLSGAPQTTPAAKAFMQAMKHMTSLFGGDGGGGGTDTEHFHGIQLYTRDLTFAEFCNLRNQLLRAQISGDLTQQAAIEIIQPVQGPRTSNDQPRELKEADSEEIEDVPRPRPVLPTQPEAPGDSRNWCEKIQITLHQIREDAQAARERGDVSIGRAWIENKTRQFLKQVNVNLVQLYGMP